MFSLSRRIPFTWFSKFKFVILKFEVGATIKNSLEPRLLLLFKYSIPTMFPYAQIIVIRINKAGRETWNIFLLESFPNRKKKKRI